MILPMNLNAKQPREAAPAHVNPLQWHQSVGLARQACARIFRDGGSPAEAVAAFGITGTSVVEWSRAVEQIAERLSAGGLRRAA